MTDTVLVDAAKFIGAGLSTVGLIGSGVGVGVVFHAFIGGCALNPYAREELFSITLLGFALTEALALFCLLMAFLMLFAF